MTDKQKLINMLEKSKTVLNPPVIVPSNEPEKGATTTQEQKVKPNQK